MGQKNTKTEPIAEIDSKFLNLDKLSKLSFQSNSDYNGILSETADSYEENEISESEEDELESNNYKSSSQDFKVKTIFEWKEGGSNVELTGDFDNWDHFYTMDKTEEGTFRLILDLPLGFHQYSFKVDGQRRYSHKFPVYNNKGTLNNYIDTTEAEFEEPKEKKKNKRELRKLSDAFESQKVLYSNYYPEKSELYDESPLSPVYYNKKILYRKNHNRFFIKKTKSLISVNKPYKELDSAEHIYL